MKSSQKISKGLILAGGKGTRLAPLTYDWLEDKTKFPKALIPVHNKPIIEWLVDWFVKNGIIDIYIAINKQHKEDFKAWKNSSPQVANIQFLVEGKNGGTFLPLLTLPRKWFNEPIVMSYGDELKDFDLRKMIQQHLDSEATITMGIRQVNNPKPYGQVLIREKHIIKFVKDKNQLISSSVDAGIYIVNPDIKEYDDGRNFQMMEDRYPWLIINKELDYFLLRGRWFDCGNWQSYEEAIKNW